MEKTKKIQKVKKVENMDKDRIKVIKNKVKQNNNIIFYARSENKLIFEKMNYNILQTNKKWKSLYYLKNNYNPIQEEYYYRNGGYFSFNIIQLSNNLLNEKIKQLIDFIKTNDNLVGIRIRNMYASKCNQKSDCLTIEIWSIYNYNIKNNKNITHKNSFIKNEINKIFGDNLISKIIFIQFYPNPIPEDETVSMIKLRNKIIYFLRYDYTIGKKLYISKQWWELFMLKYFQQYYKKNTNVIDIGGNIGTHSLLLSEIVSPGSKIYVFEPVFWDITERNIKANHLEDKIILYKEGVGKKEEELEIDTFNRNCSVNFGNFSLIQNYKNPELLSQNTLDQCKSVKKDIKIVTLDSKNFENVSLIKIDVEGMELDVLEGALETIKKNRPVIFIEVWKKEKNKYMNSDISKKIIKDLHYKMIKIEDSYAGDDYILIPKNMNKNNNKNNKNITKKI